jgi:hypothetical protein
MDAAAVAALAAAGLTELFFSHFLIAEGDKSFPATYENPHPARKRTLCKMAPIKAAAHVRRMQGLVTHL